MSKNMMAHILSNPALHILEITPNIIYNRFDILYDTYDVWELTTDNNRWVIPVHFDTNAHYLYAGVYLVDIPRVEFKQLIQKLREHYSGVERIYLDNSCCKSIYLTQMTSHVIPLPSTQEEFIESISSKTKKHLKQYARRITQELGHFEIKHLSRNDISRDIIELYFKYKKVLYDVPPTHTDPEEYLDYYHITDLYTLDINGIVEAIICPSITDKNVFLQNLTYNPEMAKYSLGTLLYYNVILDLISSQKKKLFTGNGSRELYEYKYRFGAKHITTYSGYLPKKISEKYMFAIKNLLVRFIYSHYRQYRALKKTNIFRLISNEYLKYFNEYTRR